MRRPLVLCVALVAALVLAGPALAGPLYVVNVSAMPASLLAEELPAWRAAITLDFAPAWGVQADLVVTDVVPPGAPWIELVDHPDCWFCAGYHDTVAGVPHAQIGVSGDAVSDSNTATHEIFELLADPFINRGVLVTRRPGAKPTWFALEVSDPVEADRLSYFRPGLSGRPVAISDFVTEAWFRRGSRGPWDFAGATKRPLQVLEDGYQLLWTGWAWASLPRRDRD